MTTSGQTRSDTIHVDVLNAGKGVARGCGYILVSGDHTTYASGHLGTGTLRPGEGAVIKTLLPMRSAKLSGVLTCRDVEGNVWAWDFEDSTKRRINSRKRRKRGGHLNEQQMLDAFYPELDLKHMTCCYSTSETDRYKETGRSAEHGKKPEALLIAEAKQAAHTDA